MSVFDETPPDPNCKKCKGKGSYMYDENHGTICDACCPHDRGFWQLTEHHSHPGKWCCLRGCGFIKDLNDDNNT